MKRVPSKSTRNAPSPRTASEISGCWPLRVGPEPHHGRVELHELEVAQRRAGAQRERHAVAGGHRRVGRLRRRPGRGRRVASTTARQWTAPTPSRWPSPSTCRVSPATPPSAASSSRSTASACWTTSISGARSTAAISARWISAPVASPPACAIRSRWWPPSRVSDSSPSGSWSKLRAERDQLADRLRALGDQDPHGLDVARARAGHQGVVLVLLGGVAGAERRGDAALRPLGRAGVEHVLGDDQQSSSSRPRGCAARRSARRCRSR